MASLTDEQARLLLEPNFATVGTVGPDGAVQLSVVWIDYDGENVVFNTEASRAKPRNLERDPRVTILVYDRDEPYRYLEVRGRAQTSEEGAVEHIDKLSHKYRGAPFGDRPDERRLIVRVRPDWVDAHGFE
jgi:PPOX class probable F420-dependent enzyme